MAGGAKPALKPWERWLYGGMGAIAPIAVAAIATDFTAVFQELQPVVFFGWLARTGLLFLIGGLVVSFQRTETDQWRAFVMGMGAPALLTTYISNAHAADLWPQHAIQTPSISISRPAPSLRATGVRLPNFVRASYTIATAVEPLCVSATTSTANQFARGFWGQPKSAYSWMVAAGVETAAAAERLLEKYHKLPLEKSIPNFNPKIYAVPDTLYSKGRFLVVLARDLSKSQADAVFVTKEIDPINADFSPIDFAGLAQSLVGTRTTLPACKA